MHRYVILHEKFDCGINFCETFLLFNNDILGRHKQDLVKTLEIYFYSSQDHEMFISWKFQLNSFIFKQNIKCRKRSFSNEPRCIYLNWNNFWTKILSVVFEKIHKKLLFTYFKKIDIFLKNSVQVIFCSILSSKFKQKNQKYP